MNYRNNLRKIGKRFLRKRKRALACLGRNLVKRKPKRRRKKSHKMKRQPRRQLEDSKKECRRK
jgi:hypothetical protein